MGNKIPRPSADDYLFADEHPGWLNTPSPFDELDEIWKELIVFYVFHVPVSGMSARAKTLESYGWGTQSKKGDLKKLKNRLVKYGNMTDKTFECKDGWSGLKESYINNNLIDFPQDIACERVSYRKTKSGVNDSLLSHIRNSFAHGRLAFYSKNDKTYIAMEDIDDKKHVSARLILSKETLCCWKSIIELGPSISSEELKHRMIQEETNGSTNI